MVGFKSAGNIPSIETGLIEYLGGNVAAQTDHASDQIFGGWIELAKSLSKGIERNIDGIRNAPYLAKLW